MAIQSFDDAMKDDRMPFAVNIGGKEYKGHFANIRIDRASVLNGWNVYEFGNGDLSMCVSVEALAALGVCGAIFYFKYIWDLSIGCYLRVRRLSAVEREDKQLLYALLLAHVFIFAILQFNQNILRTVYWTHLMLICTLWSILSAQNRETKKAGQAKEQD